MSIAHRKTFFRYQTYILLLITHNFWLINGFWMIWLTHIHIDIYIFKIDTTEDVIWVLCNLICWIWQQKCCPKQMGNIIVFKFQQIIPKLVNKCMYILTIKLWILSFTLHCSLQVYIEKLIFTDSSWSSWDCLVSDSEYYYYGI